MNNPVAIGLGSNSGDRVFYISSACRAVIEELGPLVKASSLYESEPWGFKAEKKFLNAVITVNTGITGIEILEVLLKIERNLGRERSSTEGYASRTIDLDLLLYAHQVINEDQLKVPHPLLQERKFVLVPLAEIESTWIHPTLGKTISQLLEECLDPSVPKKFGAPGLYV